MKILIHTDGRKENNTNALIVRSDHKAVLIITDEDLELKDNVLVKLRGISFSTVLIPKKYGDEKARNVEDGLTDELINSFFWSVIKPAIFKSRFILY